MKAKLMIILATIGLMLTIVSCEQEQIEGEIKHPLVDETIAVLTKNDWGSKSVTGSGTTTKTTDMKLHFTDSEVTLFTKTVQPGSINTLTYTRGAFIICLLLSCLYFGFHTSLLAE